MSKAPRDLLKEYIRELLIQEVFTDTAFNKSEKRRQKFKTKFDTKKETPRVEKPDSSD
jgi:hypothetical protein